MSTPEPIKQDRFYFIHDVSDHFILEDKTKLGLEVKERYLDPKYGADCESGTIYDGGGTGHKVGIRWYFPKSRFSLDKVVKFAEEMNDRYQAIREMTCPDD
ncbi:MAG TPA: hypothetical protein VE130_01050 [Nitrososphaeraceae archaeon]|jgi:hypothetical protein|nr:hypothetical protein [Nitrososphaeraceae archaeon]